MIDVDFSVAPSTFAKRLVVRGYSRSDYDLQYDQLVAAREHAVQAASKAEADHDYELAFARVTWLNDAILSLGAVYAEARKSAELSEEEDCSGQSSTDELSVFLPDYSMTPADYAKKLLGDNSTQRHYVELRQVVRRRIADLRKLAEDTDDAGRITLSERSEWLHDVACALDRRHARAENSQTRSAGLGPSALANLCVGQPRAETPKMTSAQCREAILRVKAGCPVPKRCEAAHDFISLDALKAWQDFVVRRQHEIGKGGNRFDQLAGTDLLIINTLKKRLHAIEQRLAHLEI